jgi:heme/copper-type cytochrome/quinol oxidase subunit 2
MINNQISRLNSNRYLIPGNENQKEPTVNQENNIENKTSPEKPENKTKINASKKLIIFLLIFLSIIIISFIILMIGYFCFDWFKKSKILWYKLEEKKI